VSGNKPDALATRRDIGELYTLGHAQHGAARKVCGLLGFVGHSKLIAISAMKLSGQVTQRRFCNDLVTCVRMCLNKTDRSSNARARIQMQCLKVPTVQQ
jgi:hypothetical protein